MPDVEQLKKDLEEILEELKTLQPGSRAYNLMEGQKIAIEAQLTGDGAIAIGKGAKAVGAGGILVEGNFQGNIYMGADPAEDEKRLAIYRRWVLQSTASLPLRGVDVGASDPTGPQKSIGLANVYVDLDTTTRTTKEQLEKIKSGPADFWLDGPNSSKVSFVSVKDDGEEIFGKDIPLPVLSAVIHSHQLVLLGEPGGGKSTFVNFLAHCLAANALEPGRNWISHLNGWPQDEAYSLPLVVILRDFARSYVEKLPDRAEPQHLMNFIKTRLETQNLGFALPLLEKALDKGQAIVLLDGLDEVPTQAQRIFVRDAVHSLIGRYPKGRFLVTCRVLSYQSPDPGKADLRLNELLTFEIAPFDTEKIDRFVMAWYAELGHIGSVLVEDVPRLTVRLGEAVRRPDLQRLAPNPLLLTVMSLVHTHRGRLPDARALLHEETIDILLWRWEQIKLGGQDDTPRLRQYLLAAGRTDVDLKRVLWQLAYEAHAESKPDASSETLADLSEHRILKALSALKVDEANPHGDLSWAKNLVELMKVRAGLLLERQPEIFTFPHRTFQEYLAGAHLAAQANFSALVAGLARKDSTHWREAILYAVGKLVYVNGDVDKPLALVAELCPVDAQDDDISWRLAWLAGEVLQEIGAKRAQDGSFGRDLLKRCQDRVKDLVTDGKLAPKERANAGRILAKLGDPRPEVLTCEHMVFCQVPAGEFLFGESKKQEQIHLPEYWVGKYLVTNAQFNEFVAAGGYKNPAYWAEAIKRNYWSEAGFKGTVDKPARTAPDDYGEPYTLPNHPVGGVSWYEAMAFTHWLSEQFSRFNKTWLILGGEISFEGQIKPNKLQVALPTEEQWEKAARGTDGRKYPWGTDFDQNKANTSETGIRSTTAVGLFPAGKSPYGLLDVSGNIWEWTSSLYDQSRYVLRGGAFYNNAGNAHCTYRYWNRTFYWYTYLGFRIVLISRA
jgi:formylglycine-generating enzyme required for sulfatase activity